MLDMFITGCIWGLGFSVGAATGYAVLFVLGMTLLAIVRRNKEVRNEFPI